MLYSKVRIEFSEQMGPDVFNVVARESGTTGENMLGTDVGQAVKATPRPLLVLAEAIDELYKLSKSEHPLVVAARKYMEKWQKFDAAAEKGIDPLSMPWPDGAEEGD